MTEKEIIESGLPLVNSFGGDTFLESWLKLPSGTSPTRPVYNFNYPLKLGEAATASGGIFAPIRNPCPLTAFGMTTAQCSAGALEENINAACVGGSTAPSPLGVLADYNGLTDASGRLSCETRCRDRRTQVRRYVDEMLGKDPYILVEEP